MHSFYALHAKNAQGKQRNKRNSMTISSGLAVFIREFSAKSY
jgi:hypothetical protein